MEIIQKQFSKARKIRYKTILQLARGTQTPTETGSMWRLYYCCFLISPGILPSEERNLKHFFNYVDFFSLQKFMITPNNYNAAGSIINGIPSTLDSNACYILKCLFTKLSIILHYSSLNLKSSESKNSFIYTLFKKKSQS